MLDTFWLVVYAGGRALFPVRYFTATYLPMAEMLVGFLWSVFWVASSVSFAAQVPQANDRAGTARTATAT